MTRLFAPFLKKLGLTVEDIGNLEVKQPEEMPIGEKRAKYLQEIAETCADIAKTVEKSLAEEFLPLVLGGDHSIAAGAAAGSGPRAPPAGRGGARHRGANRRAPPRT